MKTAVKVMSHGKRGQYDIEDELQFGHGVHTTHVEGSIYISNVLY